MTPQEFANKITGQKYPFHLDEQEFAKHHNLVVLWGHDDDLLKMDGLTRDEYGIFWDGVSCRFDKEGFLPINGDGTIQGEELDNIQECRELVNRYDSSVEVKVEWHPDGANLSWRITADAVPEDKKAVFVVMEDGEPMCEGLVIKMEANF